MSVIQFGMTSVGLACTACGGLHGGPEDDEGRCIDDALTSGCLIACNYCGHSMAFDNGRIRSLTRDEAAAVERCPEFAEWREVVEEIVGRFIG